jgi:glutamine amidotransferase-like uncharacterized protein
VPILLFAGSGTSPNDVAAVEAILDRDGLQYATADTSQFNAIESDRLGTYRLLIVPGGDFIDIGNGLSPTAIASVRAAVARGLNYLGICAGGFLAGHLTRYKSLDLAGHVVFRFYSAEAAGIRKAAVSIATADAAPLEQYWEDGPQFSGWGSVVGKYPDGTPAIVESPYGRGLVVLAGIHAEAPESWRRGMNFNTSATADNDYASTLVLAALHHKMLAHF